MWFLKIVSQLPLSALYRLADFLFFVSFYLLRYRRKVVQQNLRNSFPQKSPAELARIEKAFFKNLADYAVETLKLLSIEKEDLQKRMVFANPEILLTYQQQKQSVLLLASHQFNWEWLLAAGSFGLGIPIDFVYQSQGSKLFNQFALLCRTRFGAFAISRDNVAREAIRRRSLVRGTAIVADQFPGHHNSKRYWTTFMGQRTAFFHGISQLMVFAQSPVFFAAVKKVKRGYYRVELIPLANPPFDRETSDQVIDLYVKKTEEVIGAQPEGWLWSHKRWKQLD